MRSHKHLWIVLLLSGCGTVPSPLGGDVLELEGREFTMGQPALVEDPSGLRVLQFHNVPDTCAAMLSGQYDLNADENLLLLQVWDAAPDTRMQPVAVEAKVFNLALSEEEPIARFLAEGDTDFVNLATLSGDDEQLSFQFTFSLVEQPGVPLRPLTDGPVVWQAETAVSRCP